MTSDTTRRMGFPFYCVALMILTKSGLREAPPTREPSMSGQAASSRQFSAVTDPPYKIRVDSATWMRQSFMDTHAYAFLLICVMFKFTKKKVRKVTMKVLEGLLLCLMILMTIITRVVDPDPDLYWIRIQLEAWIRIRIRNTDPDPDPGGQKWPKK